jgi:hypothetical protein
MAVQQISITALSNPEDRDKLLKVIRECSDSLTRTEAESDFIRESVIEISNNLQLPKKLINKMIKVYHKQNYDEEVAVQDQFQTLYETVVK